MSLRINTNTAALNAYRNLSVTSNQMAKALERLSSGFRINRAADDAAGLAIADGLQSQVSGLTQAARNAQDGINVVQTADGALSETTSILQRMRTLAVQASNTGSNDTNSLADMQAEVTQLNNELDRISSKTTFNNVNLLTGTFGVNGGISAGTQIDGSAAIGANTDTFKVTVTSGGVAGAQVTVTLAHAGGTTPGNTAAGAAALQVNLQKDIDATALKGQVKASVVFDAVTGKLQVSLSQLNATQAGDSFTTAAGTNGLTDLGITAGASSAASGTGGIFQVGYAAGDTISVSIASGGSGGSGFDSTSLGVAGVDLTSNPGAGLTSIDAAIKSVDTARAGLGAMQNRFEHVVNSVNVAVENLSASASQIKDTDMAKEMTEYSRTQILQQAGTAMLAQANSAPQSVLKLLQG
jgi:flagellin